MRITIFGLTALLAASAAQGAPAPSQIDLTQFPAAAVDDVVVPVPSEVFNVLAKLGNPNWKGELRDSLGRNSGNRTQIALLLGTVIAEGFIAVEAEDSDRVKDIGREVLGLSQAIGVQKAVVSRSNAIVEKADQRDWPGVRKELDGALQDVRGAMNELDDHDLAQLVSLGGWIRGTDVLTSIVQKDYKPQRAELLHQPELLAYFDRQLDEMNPRLRKSDLVSQIKSMLGEIKPLIIEGDGRKIRPESVERINVLTSELVIQITAADA